MALPSELIKEIRNDLALATYHLSYFQLIKGVNYGISNRINSVVSVCCRMCFCRGNSLTWFILGLIFGPLAFIVAIVSGKRCPHCLSVMPKEAKVFASCSKDV